MVCSFDLVVCVDPTHDRPDGPAADRCAGWPSVPTRRLAL